MCRCEQNMVCFSLEINIWIKIEKRCWMLCFCFSPCRPGSQDQSKGPVPPSAQARCQRTPVEEAEMQWVTAYIYTVSNFSTVRSNSASPHCHTGKLLWHNNYLMNLLPLSKFCFTHSTWRKKSSPRTLSKQTCQYRGLHSNNGLDPVMAKT